MLSVCVGGRRTLLPASHLFRPHTNLRHHTKLTLQRVDVRLLSKTTETQHYVRSVSRAFEMSIISAHVPPPLPYHAHHIHSYINSFTNQCTNPAETQSGISRTNAPCVEEKSKTKQNILQIQHMLCPFPPRPRKSRSQELKSKSKSESQNGSGINPHPHPTPQCKFFHQHRHPSPPPIFQNDVVTSIMVFCSFSRPKRSFEGDMCGGVWHAPPARAEVGKERTCGLGHVAHGQEESDMRTVGCLCPV